MLSLIVRNYMWFCAALIPLHALAADAPPSPGQAIYDQFCAACHDHPQDRIPARETLAKRSSEEVMQALTNGAMRVQAAGLTRNDRLAVTSFLTGREPVEASVAPPEKNRCARAVAATDRGPQWNGWGRDLENSRFQPQPGFAAAEVPKLKVKWAFGYRATSIYGQPTVVGGRVYVTSASGRIYSLDAKTGCTYWTFDAPAPARTAMSVARLAGGGLGAIFGDDTATVYWLDATTGKLLWKARLDTHPSARISGAPVFYEDKLYVPVSSLEELAAANPAYECCTFRGSIAALDARDGRVLWQTYTIDESAKPYRKSEAGTQLYGPAGGSIWSAPTLDPQRGLLYVGIGNSYTDVPTAHTDAVMALEMSTGAVRWVNQLLAEDNYVVGCEIPSRAGQGNCPQTLGPDVDFGTSPILRRLPDGREVLLTGQKSGQAYGLDPESGKQLWMTRVGVGSSLGGIEWGGAADATQMYVAVSDFAAATGMPGGIMALRIADGRPMWRTPPPRPLCSWGPRSCSAAQSQAVTAIPGVVFSGSHDGHLRAYETATGRIIWTFDTAQSFQTVNGVAASGGSLDHGGATVAGGMLYVNSGYGRINGQPGNVLLAFAVGR
ncbi:MAG TPA: PQQ-binding-like beta-propeller repeat protein [Steroidobacteraceae bacterium]|nr:PQQ-binding-like beta-propeller repeat protein [Steroidobacteraceae bacterium]